MEMKEYMAPEMEVIKLQINQHLLEGSIPDEVPGDGGDGADVP